MKTTKRAVVAVIGMVALMVSTASAQEPTLDQLFQKIKQMEQKYDASIAELTKELQKAKEESRIAKEEATTAKAELARYQTPSTDASRAVQMTATDDNRGLTIGVEVPLLKLSANHGAGETDGGNSWFNNEFSTQPAFRIIAAYQWGSDLGVAGRYFAYDVADNNDKFDLVMYDFAFTASLYLQNWTVTGFAGVQHAEIKWSDEDGASGFKFAGTGITLGAKVNRKLLWGLSLDASVRFGHMFGETTEVANDDTSNNVAVSVIELYAGLRYTYAFWKNHRIDLGAGYETMMFPSLSGNVDNDIDPEDIDISLSGPRFTLSYSYRF